MAAEAEQEGGVPGTGSPITERRGIIPSAQVGKQRGTGREGQGDGWSDEKEEKTGSWLEVDEWAEPRNLD